MKIELNQDQIDSINVAMILASSSAVLAMGSARSKAARAKAEAQYKILVQARNMFRAAAGVANASDESFAPYQIVAVDDAGGPEGGKLMYYVQNEYGQSVSERVFSYDRAADIAQAMANVRSKHGVAVDGLVAA